MDFTICGAQELGQVDRRLAPKGRISVTLVFNALSGVFVRYRLTPTSLPTLERQGPSGGCMELA
jgi:hypothetical protein